MTHAWVVAQGRKEHVRPTVCAGKLTPLETRRHWVSGTAERLLRCNDCGAVLALVGETVDWSMNAADWKTLGA
jgi:hypothetical protein